MIELTRLNGQRFAINADLIERIDVTPDTVITLVDGGKYLVAEPLPNVLARIRSFRASIVAEANHALEHRGDLHPLRVVPTCEE